MPSTIFLREQLEYVQQEVVKQDFPEMLMGSGALLPISDELPVGAETYSYRILTFVGSAAILANSADDIPEIDAYAEKRVGQIRTIADAYSYSLEDMEAAEFTGMNIDAELAIGAREIIERTLDILGYDGDSKFNLLGWLNHANVPTYTVLNDGNENGGTNSTEFRHKTPEQIYRDLRQFAAATRSATNRVETPEVIALPETQHSIVMETPYPTNSASGETVGTFFLKTQRANPGGVQALVPAPYLAGKGAGGTDLMVSYRKRMNKIKYHIPLAFQQRPPSPEKRMKYEVVCRARSGGVQVTKPLSMRYASGI